MCLAQGHNALMPVKLEPVALRYRVKHSTTACFIKKEEDFYTVYTCSLFNTISIASVKFSCLLVADFFFFKSTLSEQIFSSIQVPSAIKTVWILIRPDVLSGPIKTSGPIRVQTICKMCNLNMSIL